MQIRLLGPVDVVVRGEPRPVYGLRRKTVLTVLALHSGEVVSTGQLTDAVWGQDAPLTALNSLHAHLSYLRGVLGTRTAILARPPGYVLQLPGDGTDVQVAERLLDQGTQCADPVRAVRLLQDALALWRGQPLADVAGPAWLSAQEERLDLLRMRIRQGLSEARLAAGDHARLVPELELMAADYPLDERVHGQLMLALYRCGRQADALAVYHRLRRTLGEELGIDPSRDLRDLETSILQQDPSLDASAPAAAALVAPVPAQLPPAVPGFTGRGRELARLDAIAARAALAGPASPAAVVISAVSGTAGVGKTALAVHWAHQVAGQFPDGQLYVNLRGFDPAGAALDPGQALSGFLVAFGVPATRIPEDLAGRAGLFRSLLAGKRVLVMLDNARSAEQVRPLLPGSPGCLAVVTSRNELTGLVATEGACPLALDLLTDADARGLLTRRLGAGRVSAEPEAVERIIAACAGLPLALTIAAARAATSPSFPLAAIATELREATSALDPFDGGESATDVRAVFSWSYRALSDAAARMFRLLGLHPGPDIALHAAASLAAVPPGRARALLTELTRAHLLAEHAPGRYACHDLLRAYASELARADARDAQDAAVGRALDYYLHSAHAAAALMEAVYYPVTLGAPPPGVTAGAPATAEEATAWFTAEQATLLAAVRLGARTGPSDRAWQLAWALSTFLLRRGQWHDQATACRAALDAARRAGNKTGEAHSLERLAAGYAKSGRIAQCRPLYEEALRLLEALGDHASQAHVHRALLWIAERQQRPAEMLSHAQRCYDLYQRAGHRTGQAMALQAVGHAHALLGNYDEAITHCERSLAEMKTAGERAWESAVWDSLGYIHHHRGDFRQAIACYERAISLARELTDRFNEADALNSLGDVHLSAGDPAAARTAWTGALRIFDEINHPDRDHVRAKLRAHDQLTVPPDRSRVDAAPPT
jgi:DNA-binding SARP family transcriptional activator/tetratricopeptide (TPR) repeat protein